MRKNQVVIALNGKLKGTIKEYTAILNKENTLFIAADGGVLLFEQLGITPDVLIGDFDSIKENQLIFYRNKDVKIVKYPVKKDETDGELAIKYCLENGFDNIVIIGAQGGRLDQQLANILLMEYGQYHDLNVKIKEPGLEMGLILSEKTFDSCNGDYLSLIPLSKQVSGVSLKGCKYPLYNEELYRYKSRGISNMIIENTAKVILNEGILVYLKHSNK